MNGIFEKRRDTRIDYWKPITIEESGDCFIYRARLADYSRSGIYFETDFLLHPRAKVYIGIEDSTHMFISEGHGSFLVEIIWRKRLKEISFNYGYGAKVIFDGAGKKSQKNNHDEMKELRKNPRKSFSKPTFLSFKNRYYKGAIRNISRSGVFIESEAKFSTGDELKFVIPGTKKYALLKGEIIHFNLTGFGVKFKSVLKIEKLPVTPKITL